LARRLDVAIMRVRPSEGTVVRLGQSYLARHGGRLIVRTEGGTYETHYTRRVTLEAPTP
jgi:hypothetical protein